MADDFWSGIVVLLMVRASGKALSSVQLRVLLRAVHRFGVFSLEIRVAAQRYHISGNYLLYKNICLLVAVASAIPFSFYHYLSSLCWYSCNFAIFFVPSSRTDSGQNKNTPIQSIMIFEIPNSRITSWHLETLYNICNMYFNYIVIIVILFILERLLLI